MVIFKKIIGVVFALLGVLSLLLSFVGGFSFGLFVVAALSLLAAVAFLRKPKPEESSVSADRPVAAADPVVDDVGRSDPSPDVSAVTSVPDGHSYSFKVAGISFRQKDLDDILLENYEYDMSKAELVDLGMTDERIYKYIDVVGDVALIPEPENEHDPDAIKVCIDDVHVGYVPSGKTKRVRKLLDVESPSLSCEVVGGPYKIVREEYDDDKDRDVYRLEKCDLNIGLEVTLRYS